jgi:hypothetical protein
MEFLQSLPLEAVASGVAGLLVAGAMIRAAIKGYIDGRSQTQHLGNTAAMMSAVAIGFDKAQRDQLCLDVARIAKALEDSNLHMSVVAQAQTIQADKHRSAMDQKLDELLEKADQALRQRDQPMPRRPGGPR